MKNQLQILIADDHEIFREGLRRVLACRPEWSVCAEASNGREAVAKAVEFKPRVTILDFSMPELNGLEAAHAIRKAVPQTEVLILTMYTSDRFAHEALLAGAKGFLFKSDAKRHLLGAVEALSEHRTFFTPAVSSLLLNSYLQPEAQRQQSAGTLAQRLTQREGEILQLIAEGNTNKEIAGALGVSESTIESHRANMLRRLNLHSAVDLVRYAIRNHLIEP